MARITMEEANEYLNQVMDELPPEITRELNGGIVLVPDVVHSSREVELFTLGRYHYQPHGMGRYIEIYYGSVMRVHGYESLGAQKEAFKKVLFHELTHHIESLAGVRDLEIEDEKFLSQYRNEKK